MFKKKVFDERSVEDKDLMEFIEKYKERKRKWKKYNEDWRNREKRKLEECKRRGLLNSKGDVVKRLDDKINEEIEKKRIEEEEMSIKVVDDEDDDEVDDEVE